MAEADSLNDIYIDIPFIEESNEEKKEESLVVPWLTENSDTPSPSSSYIDDGILITRKHTVPFVYVSGLPNRTSSLDDLRRKSDDYSCAILRYDSRRSHYSEYGGSFRHSRRKSTERKSSVRSSVRSYRSRKSSSNFERSRSTRSSKSSNRIPSVIPQPIQKTEEELKRERRHRIAVWLVLGAFIFIAISSILIVMVTLTHQSEYVHDNNNTFIYYTFLKPSNFTQVMKLKHIYLKFYEIVTCLFVFMDVLVNNKYIYITLYSFYMNIIRFGMFE